MLEGEETKRYCGTKTDRQTYIQTETEAETETERWNKKNT